jgi:hypothetical protein
MAPLTLDQILDNAEQAPQESAKLPQALPTQIDDPNLRPQFTDTPDKQLLEYKIRVAAQQAGIDPHMAASVAHQESGFNPNAVSQTGVKGIMQVSGIAAKDVGYDPKLVRSDVDTNIMAGVNYLAKHGLDKYPDPAVKNSYVKSVMDKTEKSKSGARTLDDILNTHAPDSATAFDQPAQQAAPEQVVADVPSGQSLTDLITGHKPAMTESQVGAGATLAGAKSYLDAIGVGALSRLAGKTDTGKGFSESFNNGLDILKSLIQHGDTSGYTPKTVEQRAQEVQPKIEVAQAEHPIASGAGTVAGILAPIAPGNVLAKGASAGAKAIPGAAKVIEAAPKLAKALGVLTGGAIQGGAYEATTNPNATSESVGKAATVGAATNAVITPLFAVGAAASKGFGKALVNFVVKNGKPEVADYIQKFVGPTLNKASMITKNSKILENTEQELQNVLSSNANAAKTINVSDKIIPQDIMKIALRKSEAGLREEGDRLVSLAAKIEKNSGNLTLPDANELKRLLWKESKFKVSGDPSVSEAAQFAYNAGSDIMQKIESTVGGKVVKQLNQKLASGIHLQKVLDASSSPNKLRAYMEAATALAHPTSIPLIAAGRLATSVPGATTISAAAHALPEAVNPSIQTILNTLVPQAVKKKP